MSASMGLSASPAPSRTPSRSLGQFRDNTSSCTESSLRDHGAASCDQETPLRYTQQVQQVLKEEGCSSVKEFRAAGPEAANFDAEFPDVDALALEADKAKLNAQLSARLTEGKRRMQENLAKRDERREQERLANVRRAEKLHPAIVLGKQASPSPKRQRLDAKEMAMIEEKRRAAIERARQLKQQAPIPRSVTPPVMAHKPPPIPPKAQQTCTNGRIIPPLPAMGGLQADKRTFVTPDGVKIPRGMPLFTIGADGKPHRITFTENLAD